MPAIYLDYNASTPLDPKVFQAMVHALEEEQANPSSAHSFGKESRKKIERSREIVANYFKVKNSEVIFTSGGTEGAAFLIQGILKNQPGHVISSSVEHACVYENLKQLNKNYQVSFLPTGEWGAVKAENIEKEIRQDTRLIALMAVNNETGVMTDIEAIARIAHMRKIPFIIDGVAWLGKAPMHLPLGVSAAFFSGHKIYGPKGIGCCICRSGLKLSPLLVGGNQEFNRRAGTENLSGIIGFAEAIVQMATNEDQMINNIKEMRDFFEKEIQNQLNHVVINGEDPRVCNTSNIAFLGCDGESLLIQFDLQGLAASHGSACSSGALEPSRILREMGLSSERVNSSIRFSLGRMTTKEDIQQAIHIIVNTVNKMRIYSV